MSRRQGGSVIKRPDTCNCCTVGPGLTVRPYKMDVVIGIDSNFREVGTCCVVGDVYRRAPTRSVKPQIIDLFFVVSGEVWIVGLRSS